MKINDLSKMSADDLWALHQQIVDILASKIREEKAQLEKRLSRLHLRVAAPSGDRARRPYPPVRAKFRNPVQPSETWSGRGKQPRWLLAQLKNGRRLDDFKILS